MTQALPLPLESQATWRLYNGGSAVSMDANGDLTVNMPTDIRFVIEGPNGTAYSPVGVTFRQAGTSDPTGAINFTLNVADQVLLVHDRDQIADSTYVYHLQFEDQNGQLHTIGF